MSPPPDESVPEAIPERPAEATGEISMLPPEEANKIAAEIRAVAESRGEDSQVVELVELPVSGRQKRPSIAPMPHESVPKLAAADDELGIDELRDAWPLLDLDERGDGLRVLPR